MSALCFKKRFGNNATYLALESIKSVVSFFKLVQIELDYLMTIILLDINRVTVLSNNTKWKSYSK